MLCHVSHPTIHPKLEPGVWAFQFAGAFEGGVVGSYDVSWSGALQVVSATSLEFGVVESN